MFKTLPFANMASLCILSLCALALSSCGDKAAQNKQAKLTAQSAQSCLADLPSPISLVGGSALIGSDGAYAEEAPLRSVTVAPFEIDAHEVTNAQFAAFIKATGYVTVAEQKPDPSQFPKGTPEYYLQSGSAVFLMPTATSPNWWHYVAGANWRHPEGPESTIDGKDSHPVVQIAYADALAYAEWAQRRLPTEAEWEYAAQGGAGTLYPWGEKLNEGDTYQANIWQGAFPIQNSVTDGYAGSAPAGCFNANAFGLYDMIGNAWEWTSTPYDASAFDEAAPIYTMKGGSYLCASNFCRRYRASARHPQEGGLGTNHIGFRTVKDTRAIK